MTDSVWKEFQQRRNGILGNLEYENIVAEHCLDKKYVKRMDFGLTALLKSEPA